MNDEFESNELNDEIIDDSNNQIQGGRMPKKQNKSSSFFDRNKNLNNRRIAKKPPVNQPRPNNNPVNQSRPNNNSINDQPNSKNQVPSRNTSNLQNKAIADKAKKIPGIKGKIASKALNTKLGQNAINNTKNNGLLGNFLNRNRNSQDKNTSSGTKKIPGLGGKYSIILKKLLPVIMIASGLILIFLIILFVSTSLFAQVSPIYNVNKWLESDEEKDISDIAPEGSNMAKFYEKLDKYNENSSCSDGLNTKVLIATLNYDGGLENFNSNGEDIEEEVAEEDEDTDDISDEQLSDNKKRLKGLVKAMEKGSCAQSNSAYDDYLKEKYIPKYLTAYYTEGADDEEEQIQKIVDDIYEQVGAYEYWFEDEECKVEGGKTCSYTVGGKTIDSPMVEVYACGALRSNKGKNATPKFTIDLDTYAEGIAFAEVGACAYPMEAVKAQVVAARSFALTRNQAMCPGYSDPSTCFVGYNKEYGVIRLEDCTNDQVYCSIEDGCLDQHSDGNNKKSLKEECGEEYYNQFKAEMEKIKGEVLVESSGNVFYANFVQANQTRWKNAANSGADYFEALLSDYKKDLQIASSCEAGSGVSLGIAGSLHLPIDNIKITSKFGPRSSGNHEGVDLSIAVGNPVYAVADGKVSISKVNGGGINVGYGNYIEICHDTNNDNICEASTRYGHLSERLVEVGDTVNGGQVIAKSGNTGRSTGPHLHFEYRDADGNPQDPQILLDEITGGTSNLGSATANPSNNNTVIAGTGESLSSNVAAGRAAEDIYYNQHDYKDAYCEGMTATYSNCTTHKDKATIETSGCSITAIATAAATLNNDPSITPSTVASWVCSSTNYRKEDQGTDSKIYSDSALQSEFGIKATSINSGSSDEKMAKVKEALNNKKMVIASLKDSRLNYHAIEKHNGTDPGNDVFGTVGGHYVVLSSINENGEFKVLDPASEARTGYHSEQVILDNYIGKVNAGIWVIESTNSNTPNNGDACRPGNYSVAGDYATWKQSDPSWGGDQLGSSGTIGRIGCAATSVAIQIARSGTTIDYNKLGTNEFNPGTFVAWMNKNGGFSGNAIIWNTPYNNGLTPNFKATEFNISNPTCSKVAQEYSRLINEGYYIVSCVKYNCGHWVAVDRVEGDTIYTFDPGSSSINTINDSGGKYPADCKGVDRAFIYKKTD